MVNAVTINTGVERKALIDLRRWRAKLPIQRTRCAESGYEWRYREGQRRSGLSNRRTARRNRRWSRTWSAGRETNGHQHHIRHVLLREPRTDTHDGDAPAMRRGPPRSTRWPWCPRPSPLSQCHGSWRPSPPCRTYWGSGWTKKKKIKQLNQQLWGF